MRAVLLVLIALLAVAPARAVERSVVPTSVGGQAIDVHLYRPDGPGPHPLIVMSHGSPRGPEERAGFGARTMERQALAYARGGVAVAVPIRRGYGGQGAWAEGYGPCDAPDYVAGGLATAQDIAAALRASAAQPGIDGSRVVLLGQSAGGWGSIAAAGSGGILGVVNFAGGRGSRRPGEVCGEERLVAAAGQLGARSRAPQLWIYASNDLYFGPDLSRRMHAAFTAAGGRARYEAVPAHGEDGHAYIRDVASWKPRVDAFLREVGFLR